MCNGNCSHGRPCDCTPDFQTDDPPEPVSSREALAMLAALVLGALVSIAGIFTIVGYLWQRFAP